MVTLDMNNASTAKKLAGFSKDKGKQWPFNIELCEISQIFVKPQTLSTCIRSETQRTPF